MIEGDLHHPQVMSRLGLEPSAGLVSASKIICLRFTPFCGSSLLAGTCFPLENPVLILVNSYRLRPLPIFSIAWPGISIGL